ncbi:MAG: hypothetical protein WC468_01505 [Candidatus Paceibacterota bacterium]
MHLKQLTEMSPEGLRELLSTAKKSCIIDCRVEEPIIAENVRIVNGAELMSPVIARVVTISDDRAITVFPNPRGIRIDEGMIFCGKLYHDRSCSFNGNVKSGEVFSKPGGRCCSSYIEEEGAGDKAYRVLLKG